MAAPKLAAVRGMNDVLPAQAPLWELFERRTVDVLRAYGYQQIRTPLVEPTALFVRGIGEATDIVEKEMYAWTDALNGDQLALRPEGTASVVRAAIEHNLLYDAPRRLWYIGPMFRHERPQRGRSRQFHQVGVEALGFTGPDIDAEHLLLVKRLWDVLEIGPVRLEINTLGSTAERAEHRTALIAYLERHIDALDADARRRLHSNPLRVLDSKNPAVQQAVAEAPVLLDYLGAESRAHFDQLQKLLTAGGVEFTVNPRLVRGLDYYNLTVFEWITDRLGAQGTICGGGRYDPLIEMLGGKPAPACGFALGIERVIELMSEAAVAADTAQCDVYVLHQGGATQVLAQSVGESLRDAGLDAIVHAGEASLKSQMKRADASGAEFAVIVGAAEAAAQAAAVKALRARGAAAPFAEQQTVPHAQLATDLAAALERISE
ncbi:MAG: histidine--tRNA ligase [Betaproteobacteria bacterium]